MASLFFPPSFEVVATSLLGVTKETSFLDFIIQLSLSDSSPLSRHLHDIEAFTSQDGLVATIDADEVFISADNGSIHCSVAEWHQLFDCTSKSQLDDLLMDIL